MNNCTKYGHPTRWRNGFIAACLLAPWYLTAQAAPEFTQWSKPASTGLGGGCPIESRNGNYLYTASPSAGTLDIWTYRRTGRAGEFGDRTRLEAPVSLDDANDFCPTPLPGHWLMFVSNRAVEGGCGDSDIYLTRYRPYPAESFGDAVNLGCAPDGPNTSGMEMSPSLVTTEAGSFLYFSSNVAGSHDLYRSTMGPDGSFSAPEPETDLNTDGDDRQPNVSRDGLTIVFASDRHNPGLLDIFMASRESLDSPWSEPVNLSVALDSDTKGIGESRPSLSWDLKRLYFGAGGTVYVSKRSPIE